MSGSYKYTEKPAATSLGLQAFCPETGGSKTFWLLTNDARHVFEAGPQRRFYELSGDETVSSQGSCVQDVLLSPQVIYNGVRDHQQGGTCYCGAPNQAWSNEGCQLPPRPGFVFAVFINPMGYVYTWRDLKEDPSDPGKPDDISGFREQIWQKTSTTS